MSKTRYATFPLDCNAVKAADEEVYRKYGDKLIDPKTGKRRKLTMEPKDLEYRNTWMQKYVEVCEAEGKKKKDIWQSTKPNRKPGDPTVTCMPATFGTTDDLLDNLKKCDGGTKILDKAKKANAGKDPTVIPATKAALRNFDGDTNHTTGTIRISKDSSKCTAMETLVFELANMSRKADFDKVEGDAAAGKLDRDQYIRGNERIEYENIKIALKATDTCKEKWGCKNHAFDLEGFRSAKDFEDYYKNYVTDNHKEHYGEEWDKNYREEYNKKHPKKKNEKKK
ncbi:MAG: hypothetical protein JXQ75_21025 [Phycisphaerae bacterium]|nr:hypothetical protein [Phycisphaerae bacterium]